MLRITLLSGGELTSIPFMELSDMDIKALKLRLHQQHGLPPRFRQKLMHSDKPLDDDTELDSVIGLEAVPTSPSKPEQLAAAGRARFHGRGCFKTAIGSAKRPSTSLQAKAASRAQQPGLCGGPARCDLGIH